MTHIKTTEGNSCVHYVLLFLEVKSFKLRFMKSLMLIDIYQDTICPWCRIGKHNLKQALQLWDGVDVSISYKPFFLNPTTPAEGLDFDSYMAAKGVHNVSFEEFAKPIKEMGESMGLTFNFDLIDKIPNTINSHQLLALVPEKQKEIILDQIYEAFFVNGENIGDINVLLNIVENVGLDRNEFQNHLVQNTMRFEVISEAGIAYARGIRGVPFFIIDNKASLYGAHPPKNILLALQKVSQMQVNLQS